MAIAARLFLIGLTASLYGCPIGSSYTSTVPAVVSAAPVPAGAASGLCAISIQIVSVSGGGVCTAASPLPSASSAPSGSASPSADCPGLSFTTGTTQTVQVQLTLYGRPDNSPPGSGQTGFSGDPQGGNGTYCDPTTYAAAYQNTTVPLGTRVYIPRFQKYFVRADDCSSPDYPNFCPGMWFDLWIGDSLSDDADGGTAVINCENGLTGNPEPVILYPPPGEPVPNPGSIYQNGVCPNLPPL